MTTYYWDSTPLASAELSAARDVLVKSSGGPEFTSAFLRLLRSGQRVRVSIALARIAAAEVLAAAHSATHRTVVDRLLASWPADTMGFGDVRMLMDDAD